VVLRAACQRWHEQPRYDRANCNQNEWVLRDGGEGAEAGAERRALG
jgi:hypothetical protein